MKKKISQWLMICEKCQSSIFIYEFFYFFYSQNSWIHFSQSLIHLASTREFFFNASNNDWLTYSNSNSVVKCSFLKLFKVPKWPTEDLLDFLLSFSSLKNSQITSLMEILLNNPVMTVNRFTLKGRVVSHIGNIWFQRGTKINI